MTLDEFLTIRLAGRFCDAGGSLYCDFGIGLGSSSETAHCSYIKFGFNLSTNSDRRPFAVADTSEQAHQPHHRVALPFPNILDFHLRVMGFSVLIVL